MLSRVSHFPFGKFHRILRNVMAFKWLNKQGVESDRGFVLQRADRDTYEYREGDRVLRLSGESMFSGLGGASFGFSFDSTWRTARWQPPHSAAPISDQDRELIIGNIKEAVAFKGGTTEFL
jgi:hypothetical protein